MQKETADGTLKDFPLFLLTSPMTGVFKSFCISGFIDVGA